MKNLLLLISLLFTVSVYEKNLAGENAEKLASFADSIKDFSVKSKGVDGKQYNDRLKDFGAVIQFKNKPMSKTAIVIREDRRCYGGSFNNQSFT